MFSFPFPLIITFLKKNLKLQILYISISIYLYIYSYVTYHNLVFLQRSDIVSDNRKKVSLNPLNMYRETSHHGTRIHIHTHTHSHSLTRSLARSRTYAHTHSRLHSTIGGNRHQLDAPTHLYTGPCLLHDVTSFVSYGDGLKEVQMCVYLYFVFQ